MSAGLGLGQRDRDAPASSAPLPTCVRLEGPLPWRSDGEQSAWLA